MICVFLQKIIAGRRIPLLTAALFCITAAFAQTTPPGDTKVKTGAVVTEVQFFQPGIVRVIKTPGGQPVVKRSFSVIQQPQKVPVSVTRKGDTTIISSGALLVKVDAKTGVVGFFDKAGNELLRESNDPTAFTPTKDGPVSIQKVRQSFSLAAGEAIYGLGQHQNGLMDQTGQRLTLLQRNMQIAVPFFQSIKGYGLLWDNTSPTIFNDSANTAAFQSAAGDCADYYFIKGASADQVIAGYRFLTGQAPMFPRWAFGFWQSRERYQSQEELLDVVRRYRALQVPLDGIVQDWQYWGVADNTWNAVEFGNPRFPDPKGMIDSVHALHAHMIISVWPSFGSSTHIFQELKANNALFGFTTYPLTKDVRVYDAYNSKARDIYWKYINHSMFSLGMDGWWMDATEPEQLNPAEDTMYQPTAAGTFTQVRSAFPLVTTGGVYTHQRQVTSAKRVFILTRSAFAGQQRYGTMTWSGDVDSRWNVLHDQVAAGCSLSLSGIPYWNSDIAGFFSDRKYPRGVKDAAYQELYVRWIEFGAFCPMMRSHGTSTPREIYQFGSKGSWAYDAIEKYIRLRYRFLPYNYSNAHEVTASAGTLMRALVMDFAADKNVAGISDEYMFGKSLLVAPVSDSMYVSRATGSAVTDFSTVKSRSVYLPAGADWFDFWTGEKYTGGQRLQKPSPINLIPLYVRAGAIVPLALPKQYADETKDSVLEIRVYPGANGAFTLYEDEGDNYNYERGAYSLIPFSWNDKTSQLTIGTRTGTFPGLLQARAFRLVKVGTASGAGDAISETPTKAIVYTGQPLTIQL